MHPRVLKAHGNLSRASAQLYAVKIKKECDDYNWPTLEKLIEPTVEILFVPTRMDKLRTALLKKNFLDQYQRYNK